jgi:hypothetical protein
MRVVKLRITDKLHIIFAYAVGLQETLRANQQNPTLSSSLVNLKSAMQDNPGNRPQQNHHKTITESCLTGSTSALFFPEPGQML